MFWGRPIATLVLLALICLLVGVFTRTVYGLGLLAAGLLLLHLYHLSKLVALLHWARRPESEPIPQARGSWSIVFSYLARLRRRHSQSESKLSATLERFQQATAAMPDAIVILDERDCIEWCNPKAMLYLGLDSRQDRGQQITNLVRPPQFSEYLQAGNFVEPLTLRLTRERELVLSVQMVPYGDRQKLVITQDITRWERLETMRRDFVANVSHELRTPLTVVRGFLETLSESSDPELTRRSLKLMSEQTLRMQRLLEDLLALARLENAQSPLMEERVDMRRLLNTLYQDSLTLSAGRHKMRLKNESSVDLQGSEDELRSAFSNIVSNAIRYTHEGGEIVLGWERVGIEAVFWVKDTGIGIDRRHIPRLTERFYRVDRSRSRDTGGTGLGLAIVKHVLNRHQARLEIESAPGKGSTFSAIFPATRVRETESVASAP